MKLSHISLLIFLLSFVLYANTLGNQFAFDDYGLVLENSQLVEGTSLREIFTTGYRHGYGLDDHYRPIGTLSYVFNNFNLNPFYFHLFNVILNALVSVILFFLFLSLGINKQLSLVATLIFAFHPIHTEVVANIAGRIELLCAFFGFSAWIIHILYGNLKRTAFFTGFLLLMALFSKETAVVFPPMFIFVDFILGKNMKQRYFSYICLFIPVLIYLYLRWLVLGYHHAGTVPFLDNPIAYSPFHERIATALVVFLHYLRLLFFPFKLSADYSFNQIPVISSVMHPMPLLALTILIISALFILLKGRKHVNICLSLIIFFAPYLLVSNLLLPIGTIMGERLMYIPSVGFSLLAGMLILKTEKLKRHSGLILMSILILSFSVRVITRNTVWYDDWSLFNNDIANSPYSSKISTNLGVMNYQRGNAKIGLDYHYRALEIYPSNYESLKGFGKYHYDIGEYSESVEFYRKALSVRPNFPDAFYDLGAALTLAGFYEEASTKIVTAINMNPLEHRYHIALGNLKMDISDYEGAFSSYRRAYELDGEPFIVYTNMIAAAYFGENYILAMELLREAERQNLTLNPEMVEEVRAKASD